MPKENGLKMSEKHLCTLQLIRNERFYEYTPVCKLDTPPCLCAITNIANPQPRSGVVTSQNELTVCRYVAPPIIFF